MIESRIREEGPAVICPAAQCLNESELLSDSSKQDVQDTIRAFEEMARDVESWSPLTEHTVSGISAACSIVEKVEFSDKVLNSVRSTLEEVAGKSEEQKPETNTLIMQLTGLASQVRELGHDEALSAPFTLPATADEWVANCAAIAEQDEWLWGLFQPHAPFAEYESFLSERVTAGEISEAVLSAVEVTNSSGIADSWNGLLEALEQRLDASQGVNAKEGTLLLRALSLLKRYQSSEAQEASKRLSDPGHLLHLFYQAQQENHLACRAWCLVTFLQAQPDAKKPSPVVNSDAGYAGLENILVADDPELSEKVVRILTDDLDEIALLFSVVDARGKYEPFLISFLRQVADSTNPLRLYSPDETIDRWGELREYLPEEAAPDRFSKLIQILCADTDLVARLRQSGFDAEDSGLYLEVLHAESEQEFATFCRAGLEELDKTAWASELTDEGYTLDLLIALQERNAEVSLKSPYQDALVDYADTLLSGSEEPSQDLVEKRAVVLSPLSQSSRHILRGRLRDAVIDKGVKYADGFFQMFGDEIAEVSLLKDGREAVAKLFSAVVRERVVCGLEWLHSALKNDPTLLAAFQDQDPVTDFKERIQGEISKEIEEPDRAEELIKEIADVLGIEPLPTKPPSEEEPARPDRVKS